MPAHQCIEDTYDHTPIEVSSEKTKIQIKGTRNFKIWVNKMPFPGGEEHPSTSCTVTLELNREVAFEYKAEIYPLPPSKRGGTQTSALDDHATEGGVEKHGPECEAMPAFVWNLNGTPVEDKGKWIIELKGDNGPSWDEGVNYFVVLIMTHWHSRGKRRVSHPIKSSDGVVDRVD